MAKKPDCSQRLGPHPPGSSIFGLWLDATDGHSDGGVPHRALGEKTGVRKAAVDRLSPVLATHHASAEQLARHTKLCSTLRKRGFKTGAGRIKVFPTSDTTRRGNFAEIVLAEYVTSSTGADLPVYRLRYNPNVDQSMKGDDLLAFDFATTPPRLLVGESKFRSTPSKEVVKEIVDALQRARRAKIPVSLQFVADRLFEQGNKALGEKVLKCAEDIAARRMRIDYVGLLLSDARASSYTQKHADVNLREVVLISLGLDDPAGLVDSCFKNAERANGASP